MLIDDTPDAVPDLASVTEGAGCEPAVQRSNPPPIRPRERRAHERLRAPDEDCRSVDGFVDVAAAQCDSQVLSRVRQITGPVITFVLRAPLR